MTTCFAGPLTFLEPNHEYDLPNKEAKRLVAAGFAVPVNERNIETATTAPLETRDNSAKGVQ